MFLILVLSLVFFQGAQTDAYAFAYSSPNPTLARKTWNPPISMEELKDRVVNIKPDPDMVSSLGDLVPNHQLVRCRMKDTADEQVKNNCHSFWRTFCEYTYTCGSPIDRAGALCVCSQRWGYPEPVRKPDSTSELSFDEACAQEEASFVQMWINLLNGIMRQAGRWLVHNSMRPRVR